MISLIDSDQLSHYTLSNSLELSCPLISPGPQAWCTEALCFAYAGPLHPTWPGVATHDYAERVNAGIRVCMSGLQASEVAQLLRLSPESHVIRLGRTFRMDDRTFLIPMRRFSLFC